MTGPRQSKKGRGKKARQRQCGGKIKYPNLAAAIAASRAIASATGDRRMAAYRCKFCFKPDGSRPYHLGH